MMESLIESPPPHLGMRGKKMVVIVICAGYCRYCVIFFDTIGFGICLLLSLTLLVDLSSGLQTGHGGLRILGVATTVPSLSPRIRSSEPNSVWWLNSCLWSSLQERINIVPSKSQLLQKWVKGLCSQSSGTHFNCVRTTLKTIYPYTGAKVCVLIEFVLMLPRNFCITWNS